MPACCIVLPLKDISCAYSILGTQVTKYVIEFYGFLFPQSGLTGSRVALTTLF